MNYSTLKKTVALSFASLLAVGAVSAQKKDSTMTSGATPKIFGGSGQYSTWTIGLNGGVTSNVTLLGSAVNFNTVKLDIAGSLTLRKQLAHSFGLEADLTSGWVSGSNQNSSGTPISAFGTDYPGITQFRTHFYSGSILGVVNVATVDFLARKNAINFFVQAGFGLQNYAPQYTQQGSTDITSSNIYFKYSGTRNGGSHTISEAFIPVGAGLKFRLNDAWALNLGYNMYFVASDNFDGAKYYNANLNTHRDQYSLGYAGIEYTFGTKSKPNLEWVNPVALMYDELKDPTLRQEVEALKARVTNVENAVNDLKKDSDGDGVADQFDKCPNTPAGTAVDGSGCPIKFPVIDTSVFVRKGSPEAMSMGKGAMMGTAAYSNIQFEFDSSVLRTSAYPILDATSADLRASKKKVIMVNGYASSEGTAAHNLQLSKDRANSVKTYLVNSGVDAKRIKVKGYGETHPVADNSTEEGRVLNRRVEFKK